MLINFNPSPKSNFTFNVTMDNVKYNCICSWNMFGQRYYISMFNVNGLRIFTLPIISSPQGYNIDISGGYFQTSKLIYRASTNQFEIIP